MSTEINSPEFDQLIQNNKRISTITRSLLNLSRDIKGNGHPILLSQVILNLVNNAAMAIEKLDDKWIKVECQYLEKCFSISITDSGIGIPRTVAKEIFSPFFTTKEKGKGTGLGLSLAKQIMENHEGSISLNEDSINTQFILKIPSV